MRGDEKRVVGAFRKWLESQGWTIDKDVDYVDLAAHRGAERLYAEAKGRTAAMGLDVDTLYGQLLRRMPEDAVGTARFAVVVPEEGRKAALRVPARVRRLLNVDVYVVTSDDLVEAVSVSASSGPSQNRKC